MIKQILTFFRHKQLKYITVQNNTYITAYTVYTADMHYDEGFVVNDKAALVKELLLKGFSMRDINNALKEDAIRQHNVDSKRVRQFYKDNLIK